MAYRLNKYQKRWLEALESGKYKQCKGVLSDGVGYCCLGVACEVLGVKRVEIGGEVRYGDCENSVSAPVEVVEKLKLLDGEGEIKIKQRIGKTSPTYLSKANDDGARFKTIAKAIRANPENFFV